MNEVLTLAIAPVGLWLILVFLKVPGVTLILSILVGKLFAEELAVDAYNAINGVFSVNDIRYIQLALLLLPVVLSIILTRSQVARSKAIGNALMLLLASVSLILFALPYTDFLTKLGTTGQEIVSSYQPYIISAAGGVALLVAWSPHLKRGKHHKNK